MGELVPGSASGKSGLDRTGSSERRLTDSQFRCLADIPPEVEWFANLDNSHTARAYRRDLEDFRAFAGIQKVEEFRIVRRSHLIAWRKSLEERELSAATIRRKLSAVSSLFEALCEANAVDFNPVSGVKRPSEGANEGKTPAMGDDQMRRLLEAPDPRKAKSRSGRLKAVRDRAILSVLGFHGLRCAELVTLTVGSIVERRGVPHFRVLGKRSKIRYVPCHPHSLGRIQEYLGLSGHRELVDAPLFQSIRGRRALDQSSVFECIVQKYARMAGINPHEFCIHSLRATAATNALEHEADIAKVQEWLGHSNISTTRLYDRRNTRPEESPTFRVHY